MKRKTVSIFCIGRELLEGAVLDRNANFLASHVTGCGFRVRSIQVVDDLPEEQIDAFRGAIAHGDSFVFVTGGMGPGHNDLTRQSVAAAAGVDVELDATARDLLLASYRRLHARGMVPDVELDERRLAMATVPKGSQCFGNPIGTAPGVRFATGPTTFFLFPGAPEELRRMFSQYAAPELATAGSGDTRDVRYIEYPGADESAISRMLSDLSRRHPGVHSRARVQGTETDLSIRITLSAEHNDRSTLQDMLDRAAADLRARLGLEVGHGHESYSE